ncbi:glyoxalase-like domain protein [Blastomonas sp. RAC04]|uniref:VOC family protein n=1 Tax=unclassified Blastomonas TaxID=2626550 RepID=UPI00083DBF28|nr:MULTISPECIES: VOC family protein [unclassified Blastomonas]AOG01095.1 glyoxalase-like domain protein [Blastomonas sp. RAC04]
MTMPLSSAKPVTFINTASRAASEPFYRDVLGLPFVADDGFAAVFDLPGAVLRITELQDYQPAPHPALGWMVDDIAATMQALIERGVTPTIYEGFGQDALGIWTAPDGVAKVAWFNDPDGNVLSLTQC